MPTMSAAERRDEAREAYNAFLADCPSHQLMARISDKWTSLIVCALADGPLRYGELARTVASISQKMLTQTLRRMQTMTLIERHRYAEAPPRVEYELTEAGRDLLIPIYALGEWADRHGDSVRSAMSDSEE